MASFRIYKALPLEVYKKLMEETRSEQSNQSASPLPAAMEQVPHVGRLDDEDSDQQGRSKLSSAARVISLLPQRQQEKSKKILEVLQRCQISWDDLGQISDGNIIIQASNIVDLLNYLTCTIPPRNAHLVGLGEIVSALKKYNAPLCLFGKEGKLALTSKDVLDGQGHKHAKQAKKVTGWTSCEMFKFFK